MEGGARLAGLAAACARPPPPRAPPLPTLPPPPNPTAVACHLLPAEAGLSRQRLESYDRAVVTDPVYYAGKAQSLIGEFENYLKILKSVRGWDVHHMLVW